MKRWMLSSVALAALALTALPGLAQEKPPVPPERLPPPLDVKVSVAAPSCEAPATFPPCESPRVVWMEYEVPIRRLVPREVITEERRPTRRVPRGHSPSRWSRTTAFRTNMQ